MAPLNALAKLIAGWRSPLLIGGGAMTSAVRKTIDDATGGSAQDATAHVQAMMRQKSPSELTAIRDACAVLSKAMAAIRAAVHAGSGATTALLAGERAAIDAGAQDIRTLISFDGGARCGRSSARRSPVEPLQVYVAVRKANHWAEGFASIAREPQPAVALAALLLDNALSAIRPGVRVSQLTKIMAVGSPYRQHPVTQNAPVVAIGLSLDAPLPAALAPGDVLSIRAGLTDGAAQHAIVSAMVAVKDNGSDVLWRSGIA
jgi:hypothetical protein